jgi:hypothetical protein
MLSSEMIWASVHFLFVHANNSYNVFTKVLVVVFVKHAEWA